ncbi:MAG: DUF2156 domain-containing protein [Anaerolineae bacterium]|nr:DUF2156 domain-containing protein [Anaerolineae bacterium]
MGELPSFPNFKELELADREVLHPRIWAFQPDISELTFGNLYVWRSYYTFEWSILDDCVIILAKERDGAPYALPPIGQGDRQAVAHRLLTWLRDERDIETPRISRADERLAGELGGDERFAVEELRDHFDYVYATSDLAEMAGRKYSAKRNHISQFTRYYRFEYQPVTPELAPECLALAEIWCEQRLCEEDLSLQHELCGIEDMLNNFETLEVDGGAILIHDKVQAFALGERLNETTAVVHIEKANPEFKGIYTKMTQAYAARWEGVTAFVNLEQDLGEPGLRRAKESYYPDHMAKKYEVTLA